MKPYEEVEMEVIVFENENILTESGDTDMPWVP